MRTFLSPCVHFGASAQLLARRTLSGRPSPAQLPPSCMQAHAHAHGFKPRRACTTPRQAPTSTCAHAAVPTVPPTQGPNSKAPPRPASPAAQKPPRAELKDDCVTGYHFRVRAPCGAEVFHLDARVRAGFPFFASLRRAHWCSGSAALHLRSSSCVSHDKPTPVSQVIRNICESMADRLGSTAGLMCQTPRRRPILQR